MSVVCVLVSGVHPIAIMSAVFCVICSLLMFVSDASGYHMMEVQKDTACTTLDRCRHLHKLCLHNPCPQKLRPDSVFWASRPSLPAAWMALLLTKAVDVESNPGPTTHTAKHTPVNWIWDLCHKQINKKQTSIRCNHNTTHTGFI